MKTLKRIEKNSMIGGVCTGLSEYFEIDSTIFRLLFAFGVLIWGTGILAYILMWIIIPQEN